MTETRLNHVALIVADMDAALRLWRDCLGLPLQQPRQHLAEESVDMALLGLGETALELLEPVDDGGGLARFMAKRGPGLHHICLEVADLEATMQALRDSGYTLINDQPRQRDGLRYAFVHPKSTGGVLLELYQRLR